MIKKALIFGVLLAITLTACGGGGNSDGTNSSSGDVTLNDDYADALPVSSQLTIGTLLLEETEHAVTVEQAGELLPSWQVLQALQGSGTAAQAELDAVLNQIQGAMTAEQLTAIKTMQLTPDSMTELIQERGLGRGFAGGQGGGGFQPPAGFVPGGGGGRGGGFAGGFGGGDLSPEEQEAALAERMNQFAGTAMTGLLVSLLEARAEGEDWEIAAPNQDFALQNTLFELLSEATGLDQQEIRTQAREGQTLLEIAGANGADTDEILAQAVAAETERINQAVADGSLEQAEAEQQLAGLETRAKEMLEEPLQFGGQRTSSGTSGQP